MSGNCRDWYENYINGKVNISDPSSGTDATIRYTNGAGANPNGTVTPGDIYIGVGNKCSSSNIISGGATTYTSRQYAIITPLDRAGTWYCIDGS